MNEITVVSMNWWQLVLFTMAIFFYGAFFKEFIPRVIEKILDHMGYSDKEKEKDGEQ